ncbi:hypothetical protein VKT23_006704 [Stygiomarasmius scandens]|uniref:Uncharacterized protein n=1 Tax=Marasmiellus scandens TaxID=2682957 RepID=A0ABR1JN62_9AGAR
MSELELLGLLEKALGPKLAGFAFSLAAEYFLYGVHAVLFCVSVFYAYPHRRFRRGRCDGHFHLIVNIILIFLGTLGVIFDSVALGLVFTKLPQSTHVVNVLESATVVTLILAAVTGHSLLSYRLFVIWERRIKIVVVPLIFVVSAHVVAILSAFLHRAGYHWLTLTDHEKMGEAIGLVIVASASLLLTTLTASRIWWIWQHSKSFTGDRIQAHYRTIFIVIVESGIIASLTTFLSSAALFVNLPINPAPLLIQVIGIVPALITVRVNLGLSTEGIENVQIGISQTPGSSQIPLSVNTTVDILTM